MYYLEWIAWRAMLETDEDRKNDHEIEKQLGIEDEGIYEGEDEKDQAASLLSVSETPKLRGPVYVYNDSVLEMRCGIWESKRGLVTILSVTTLILISLLTAGSISASIQTVTRFTQGTPNSGMLFIAILFGFMASGASWYYFKFGFWFSRLEMLTSRHLLIRFNRKTQQVYLHRPKSCGGIITLPWKGIISEGASQKKSEAAAVGVPLILCWSETITGTLHPVIVGVGKAANNLSELRDEWEFIRRFMDEGPQGLSRPWITSHFPWPWQAFTPQFEGLTHYFRNASRTIKVGLLLISPAFLIFGLGHWLSLMLCWKPRWPKVIRQAGLPGKPIPPQTTLADYPPETQERLRANAHLWAVRPGKRPEKKLRKKRPRIRETNE